MWRCLRLTNNTVADIATEFSGDGRRLLFSSARSGRRQIYVMNTDGSDVVQLTSSAGSNNHPDWSPDGRLLAFTSTRGMTDSAVRASVQPGNVFIANADGSNARQLTFDGVSTVPRFSRDGRTLAFSRQLEGYAQLHLMNLAGTHIRQTTRGRAHADGAAWSRNDRWIMYETNRAGPRRWAVWITSSDGSMTFPLLNHTCWRIFAGNWGP